MAFVNPRNSPLTKQPAEINNRVDSKQETI